MFVWDLPTKAGSHGTEGGSYERSRKERLAASAFSRVLEVLLQAHSEREAGWILTGSNALNGVIARLTLDRHGSAGEVLQAAADVDPKLGFRVPERLSV